MAPRPQIDELRLELMTSQDVSVALGLGFDTVLAPCGAVEQHGPHLPLCMDADHAEGLAALIAPRLGRTLIAPVIKVGCSSHHLGFSGTISLRQETFEAICQDYCSSLLGHGFSRIVFFSAHIGNFPALRDMLPRLRKNAGDTARIDAFTDPEAWMSSWRKSVSAAGGDASAVGGHADIAETSLMMRLRPESVRTGRFEPGHLGSLSQLDLEQIWRDGVYSVSPNGILGDCRGSNSTIGDKCLTGIADLLVEYFSARA